MKDNLLNHSSIEGIQVDSSFLATKNNVTINLSVCVCVIYFVYIHHYTFVLLFPWKKASEMELLS